VAAAIVMYHASRDDSGLVGRAVESVLRVIRGDTIEACNHAIDQRRACLISIYAYVCGSVPAVNCFGIATTIRILLQDAKLGAWEKEG